MSSNKTLSNAQRDYKISRISQLNEMVKDGLNPYPHHFHYLQLMSQLLGFHFLHQ